MERYVEFLRTQNGAFTESWIVETRSFGGCSSEGCVRRNLNRPILPFFLDKLVESKIFPGLKRLFDLSQAFYTKTARNLQLISTKFVSKCGRGLGRSYFEHQ